LTAASFENAWNAPFPFRAAPALQSYLGMKTLILVLTAFSILLPAQSSWGDASVTEYYTKVNQEKNKKDCNGEGNQIVKGQLFGSDCKPVKKYCPYGIGSRNNCLTPCKDAAGGSRYRFGQTVKIKPHLCKWGPYKGQMISEVRIADVGSGVGGSSVDFFQGLCSETKGGVCQNYVSDTMMAEYNGQHGPSVQMADGSGSNH
jgi:hypothetical protein